MSRTSSDVYINDVLVNGYDYSKQAWVENGLYLSCAHPESMNCQCYGRKHAGEACKQTFRGDVDIFSRQDYGLPSEITFKVGH